MLASFLFNDLSETLPDLRTDVGLGIGHHLVEVDGEEIASLADLLAADKDGVDVGGGDAKVELPREVAGVERGG